jgi:hypothetical protein
MDEVWKYFLSQGALGIVLAWFMIRNEAKMKAIEEAIARGQRVDLLRLAASPLVASPLKEEAKGILAEIDQSLTKK